MPIARIPMALTGAVVAALVASIPAASAQDADVLETDDPIIPIKRGLDPAADRIVRDMSEYIAGAEAFTFSVEVAEDKLLAHQHMIQYGGVAHVTVQRPGSLHSTFRGEERQTQLLIHDGRCTMYDGRADTFAVTDVPPILDDAIDHIVDRYGLNVPVADIVYRDPYDAVMAAVDYGMVVGSASIDGVDCHHLAFAQETIDWQIWVQAGPKPLLRKLVITYRTEPGWPQYTARFSEWNLEPRLSKRFFEFKPPAGADNVNFLPNPSVENDQ